MAGTKIAECFVAVSAQMGELSSGLKQGEGAVVSSVAAMQNNLSGVTATVQLDDLSNNLKRGESAVIASVETMTTSFDKLSNMAGSITVLGGAFTYAFGSAARSALNSAAAFEQTTIAFSTMMGSQQKALGLLSNLTDFAAKTPFEMPEIEQVARGMIMFGEESETLLKTLQVLGNAASGTSSDFGMLGLIYNQVRGVGKLLTQDFRQLSTRGVLSLRDIANHYKITDAAAQEMLSTGKVSFVDFQNILAGLTTGSGRFANMMEKQSKSMSGLLSTFSDAWRITMRQIGEELVPIAKWFVDIGIKAVSAFGNMDSVTKKLAASVLSLGAVFGSISTTLAGTTFTVLKLHGAYSGMMTILRSTAAMTETVGAIAGLTTGTVQMTSAAHAASIGLKTMAASAWLAKAGLWGAAFAAAALIGYNIGKWLYDISDEAKSTKQAMDDLKASIEGIPSVDYDKKLRGKGKTESKSYLEAAVKQMEDQIQRTKAHSRALEEENGLWRANSDVIAAEAASVEKLETNLAKARDKLLEFTEAGPDLDKQLGDAEARLRFSASEIIQVDKRLADEQSKLARYDKAANLTANQAADRDRLRQNIALHKDMIEVLKEEKKSASSLVDSLTEKKAASEVDDEATKKIREKTESLKTENETYGMSAIAAEAYQMKVDKVADSVIKAYVAERERTEGLKALQQQTEAMNKANEKYVEQLQSESSQPTLLPSQIPDPMGGLGSVGSDMLAGFDELGQILEESKTPAERLDDAFAHLKWQFDDGLLSEEKYRKALEGMGRSLTDSVATPAEQAAKAIKEYDKMLAAGAIGKETHRRLVEKIQLDLAPDKKASGRDPFIGFAELNRKMQEAMLKDTLGNKQLDVAEESLGVQKDMLDAMSDEAEPGKPAVPVNATVREPSGVTVPVSTQSPNNSPAESHPIASTDTTPSGFILPSTQARYDREQKRMDRAAAEQKRKDAGIARRKAEQEAVETRKAEREYAKSFRKQQIANETEAQKAEGATAESLIAGLEKTKADWVALVDPAATPEQQGAAPEPSTAAPQADLSQRPLADLSKLTAEELRKVRKRAETPSARAALEKQYGGRIQTASELYPDELQPAAAPLDTTARQHAEAARNRRGTGEGIASDASKLAGAILGAGGLRSRTAARETEDQRFADGNIVITKYAGAKGDDLKTERKPKLDLDFASWQADYESRKAAERDTTKQRFAEWQANREPQPGTATSGTAPGAASVPEMTDVASNTAEANTWLGKLVGAVDVLAKKLEPKTSPIVAGA